MKKLSEKHFILVVIFLYASCLSGPIATYGQDVYSICDSLGMAPPLITPLTKQNKSKYSLKNLDYGMTIGIELTPKCRIWNCFVGGGDNADAYFLLHWSDNDGKTWSDTKFIIDPHRDDLPFKRRTIVGQLWTDPIGRLWLFMDQAMTYYDGRAGNWYAICENPDAKHPIWSEPKYLSFGCTLNKPTVMSTGEWVLPVSLWIRRMINVAMEKGWTESPLREAHHELDSIRGAHVYVSTNQGRTWEDRAFVLFPKTSFDEHLFIERETGTWWMTARTSAGIWQSFSKDKGYHWTKPKLYQPHISSRHFMKRLQSGRLLLVRHGMLDEKTTTRSHLIAFLSEDDGKTWQGGLMIDEREGISYPTGFQADNGYIYISYDHERSSLGEILMCKFTEQDVLSRCFVSKGSRQKKIITRIHR